MPKWVDLNEIDEDEIPVKKFSITEEMLNGGEQIPLSTSVYQAGEEDFLDAMEPAKKSMTIFFLIDVSGSMKGTKIGSLNSTMEELLPSLIGVGEASTDVKIAVMKFSTQVEWVTPEPVRIEEYQFWNRLEAEGLTFMGDAFLELSRKLSRSTFLNSPSLSFAPVIFLLSDGSPNDDWKKGLAALQQNKWFQHGLKIALGIGSEVNMDVLKEFTGNEELAVQAKNADQGADQVDGSDFLPDWQPKSCPGGQQWKTGAGGDGGPGKTEGPCGRDSCWSERYPRGGC